MRPIRIVHLGLGRWGFNWAREILADCDCARVTAYVDSDPAALARAQKELSIPAAICFASLEQALAAVECDAVVISLPVALHAKAAETALRAGKHVLTEKPFADSLADAARLNALAKARGLVLMVSQNYRFYPATRAAAQLVRSRKLGELRYVKIDFRRNSQVDGYGWPGIKNPLLVDMAIHHFDLMRMIIGADPVDLRCTTWNLPGSPFADKPAGSLVLNFPDGIVVSYRGSWLDLAPKTAWAGEWQMDFARGSASWTARGGDRTNLTRHDALTIGRIGGEPRPVALKPMPLPGRSGVLAAFAKALRSGVEPPLFSSGRDNIHTLAVVEAALRSAATGGATVRLADVKPERKRKARRA
jgi:predicted dehydrogenase